MSENLYGLEVEQEQRKSVEELRGLRGLTVKNVSSRTQCSAESPYFRL